MNFYTFFFLYFVAALTALLSPLIFHYFPSLTIIKYQLYSHFILLIGQILFFIGTLIFENSPKGFSYFLMYIGRIFIGITNGSDEVTVYLIGNMFFGESKWSGLSTGMILGTFEIGTVSFLCIFH